MGGVKRQLSVVLGRSRVGRYFSFVMRRKDKRENPTRPESPTVRRIINQTCFVRRRAVTPTCRPSCCLFLVCPPS
eukprot:15778062-Heterocapsa_arctica.AAC.1